MSLGSWSRNFLSATIDYIMFGWDLCSLNDVEQFSLLLTSNKSVLAY
jgi:hypothetical protein